MAHDRASATLDPHGALIYTMVLVSAAEADLSDGELQIIGDIIGHLPVFRGFDQERLPRLLDGCTKSLAAADGIDATLDAIRAALPAQLRETAYAIACDLVAADGAASQEELRVLELIRHRLTIDRLTAAAIERGARARFQRL
ncbi:MAG TPA: tellurite resistance TerB family protein [Stellaceae bacterium]|nr:tellurite resistance TerB family protein [Stellaceae bacterium]